MDRLSGFARINEDTYASESAHVFPDSTTRETDLLRRNIGAPLEDFEAVLEAKTRQDLPLYLLQSLDTYLQKHFKAELTERATHLLHARQPDKSALSPLAPWLKYAFWLSAFVAAIASIVIPAMALQILICAVLIYCTASMTLKGALALASLTPSATPLPTQPSRTPMVTILLPVHNEGLALVSLVKELEALDYPADRLDLKFLVEENDAETHDALKSLSLPHQFEIMTIPKSHPQTKPKAMNYALPFVKGEIVGIYDAEDVPEPDQIKKAVAALEATDPSTVCVQARLNHYKATETVLSRMVQAEYTLWFDVLLRGLSRLRLPVPLGGTSLFIETAALRSIDGWDPYNVTEDADLGLRLARRGWRAEIIDSTTWEEPPVKLKQWRGQRSRWIKGFMVTWLVHIRAPATLVRELGWKKAIAINIMLLDGFLAFLLQPFFWVAIALWIFLGTSPWSSFLTPSIATATMWVFILGQAFIFIAAFSAVIRRFGIERALWTPCLWIYWQFATLPAYRAMREMFGSQTFWNKTEHGLSKAARDRRDAALRAR